MLLSFHPSALDELQTTTELLHRERPGHGKLFYEQVKRRVAQAALFPKSGAPVLGFHPKYDIRQFTLRRFPNVVITANVNDEQIVVAVAHTRQAPTYWRSRIK